MDNEFLGVLFAVSICTIIFIALREVVMWYFKINIIIENQAKQIKIQQETNNLLSEQLTLMKGHYNPEKVNSEDNLTDLNHPTG